MPLNDYDSLFEAAGKQYNVDPQLLKAVAYNESRGDPDVVAGRRVSSAGAQGLMQFMPATAKAYGIDPLDPKQAIPAAAKYLSEGLDKYGTIEGALKAYAGGPNQAIWGPQTNGYPNLVADAYGKVSKPLANSAPAPQATADDAFSAAFSAPASKTQAQPANDAFSAAFAAPSMTNAPKQQTAANDSAPDAHAPGITGIALDAIRGKLGSNPLMGALRPATDAIGQMGRDIGAAGARNYNRLAQDFTTPLDPTPLKIGNEVLPPTPPLFDRGIKIAGDAANYIASPVEGAGAYLLGRPLATATNNRLTPEQVGQDVSLVAQVAGGHVLPNAPVEAAPAVEVAGNRLLAAPTDPWTGRPVAAPQNALVPREMVPAQGPAQPQIAAGPGQVMQAGAENAPTVAPGQPSAWGSQPPVLASSAIPDKLPPKPLLPVITQAGAEKQAQRIIDHFAGSGPLNVDTSEIVPGSAPTLAHATGNPGIATLERGFMDANPGPFAERTTANDAARTQLLQNTVGTPEDVLAAIAERDRQTSTLRDAAFAPGNVDKADAAPVVAKINEILASPSGKRDAVQSALTNILAKIQSVDPATGKTVLESDPEQLYGVRKAIGDSLSPLAAGTKADGRQAARELGQVQDVLDKAIESGAPGFGKYIDAYSAASRPIDGMQYLQGLNLTDPKGNITLAKVDAALKTINKQQQTGGAKAVKSVSDDQLAALTSIRDDLRRQANIYQGKSLGSTTFQNLATNAATGALGNPLVAHGATLLGGLHPAIGIPLAGARFGMNRLAGRGEAMVQQALQNRLLNPETARPAVGPLANPQAGAPAYYDVQR